MKNIKYFHYLIMPKIIYNKMAIVNAYKNRANIGVSIKQICQIFNINAKTVNNYKHKSDDFLKSNKIKRVSFMHLLSDDVLNYVIDTTVNNIYFNAKKMSINIFKQFKVRITTHQIYTILKFNNITYKKAIIKKKTKNKTDEEIKNNIIDTVNNVNRVNFDDDTDDIVFMDEVHIDLSDTRSNGWNKKGESVIFEKNVPNKILNKRITVIASVTKNNKVGYKIYKNSVNGETFNKYVKYIGKKTNAKTYFLDNARIHHYHKVKKTIKKQNKNIIYGVPYNPQLNIIENFFRSFKTKIRNEILEKRTNIKSLIRKCWNSVSIDVLKNTYNNVYIKRIGCF